MLHGKPKPRWHRLSDPEYQGSGVLPSYVEVMQWEGMPERLDMIKSGKVEGLVNGMWPVSREHLSDEELVVEYEDLVPSWEYHHHNNTNVLFNPYPVLLEIAARHVLYGTNVLPPDWEE